MSTPRTTHALAALAFALGAAATAAWVTIGRTVPATDLACAVGSPHRRIELIFGLSRNDRPDIGDDEWREFLDREVTPRFPEGLTVLPAQGQWRDASGRAVKEASRYLLVWARPAPDLATRVEAIRDAWKLAHRQESVLHAESTDCVSF